jgi:gamma-glutamyltranspeptidase/glutathione hydrolase
MSRITDSEFFGMKLQAPSSKHQTNPKLQFSKGKSGERAKFFGGPFAHGVRSADLSRQRSANIFGRHLTEACVKTIWRCCGLKSALRPRAVGAWSLSGAWSLVVGISAAARLVAVASLLSATPHLRAANIHGALASVHPLATQAGINVLKQGGNAVDATVAMALTLGVVNTENSGIGGGCFILIHRANGELVAIDGRETAPAAATRDMFLRKGKADPALSQTGALASGVPGALAAYEFAVKHYGTKELKDLILPAADIAEKGFRLDASYANRLRSEATDIGRFDATRAIFFKDGKPLIKGTLLKQPDLAATYRHIAEQGSDWFYRGPFAEATAKWMAANGGIMTARDFAEYKIVLRDPIVSTYRGFRIVTFPPPSSGGVHLVQMLNMLEKFDLKSLDEATRLHVIAEAMKLAFADRAYWLGDPDFANVPRGLIDKSYAAALAANIKLDRASTVRSHGTPPDSQSNMFKKHTTHFSAADAEGNWVACTATINTSFGSKVVISGTGVLMNDEMDDFSAQPGVANYFGLIGAEANAVAPGKRPLSSMCPTIVLKDERPIISVGAAGGPKIISSVLLELIGMLDLGLSPAESLAQPRIHHQWSPDELMVEQTLPAIVREALIKRGHKVQVQSGMAVSQMVARTPDGSGFIGAADPRTSGSGEGW